MTGVNHSKISAIADTRENDGGTVFGVNHSKISAIADKESTYPLVVDGVNHSKISAIADTRIFALFTRERYKP